MLYDQLQFEPDEKILIKTRRHWFILFSHLFGLVVAALLPLILLIASRLFGDTLAFSFDPYVPELSFLYAAWIFILWIGAFNEWTNYYLDIVTITNKRVIVVNQRGFFRRVVASFRLERLQDMEVDINGLIETLLDFGQLNAETAGSEGDEFKITGMPNPRGLKAMIVKAADDLLDQYRVPTSTIDGV